MAGTQPTVLVVGDSLSAGFGIEASSSWVALLQKRLVDQGYEYRVVNASISGDTTGGGLRRLPRALQQHQPAIVIIELGGNDGLRGTSIRVIRSNLAKMIELGLQHNAQVLLTGMLLPPNYGVTYTTAFAGLYRELAEQYELPLVGFFMQNVALNPELMQRDGIHPNADGQPQLLDNVWEILQPELQKSGIARSSKHDEKLSTLSATLNF